jgi:hypothetical protein
MALCLSEVTTSLIETRDMGNCYLQVRVLCQADVATQKPDQTFFCRNVVLNLIVYILYRYNGNKILPGTLFSIFNF